MPGNIVHPRKLCDVCKEFTIHHVTFKDGRRMHVCFNEEAHKEIAAAGGTPTTSVPSPSPHPTDGPQMKVYVAGASSELERAEAIIAWIASQPHLTLSKDWVADVKHEREVNGRSDADLPDTERRKYAGEDLKAVSEAHIFWLLSPSPGFTTSGAWVELGVALATSATRKVLGMSPALIIISGSDAREYLFASLAHETFDGDAEAKAWLVEAHGETVNS